MIVCICHRVSDRDIERAVRCGCGTFDQLQSDLRVASGCGACAECARQTFEAQRTKLGEASGCGHCTPAALSA